MIGAGSEELAKQTFSRMGLHLDLNMTMIRPLDGVQQVEYLKEFGDIYKRLEKRLEPVLVNQEQSKRDKTYLWHEDRKVVPSDPIPVLLKCTHQSSGHVGAVYPEAFFFALCVSALTPVHWRCTLRLFKQWFHSTWSDNQLQKSL